MQTSTPPWRYVKLSVAADHLNVTTAHLRRMIAAGDLTAYRLGKGKLILLELGELEDVLRPIPTAASR